MIDPTGYDIYTAPVTPSASEPPRSTENPEAREAQEAAAAESAQEPPTRETPAMEEAYRQLDSISASGSSSPYPYQLGVFVDLWA